MQKFTPRLSILHPSRERPQQGFQTCVGWLNACRNLSSVEYLFGIDADDPTIPQYRQLLATINQIQPGANVSMIVANTWSIPSAMNNLGKEIAASSEIMVGVSDDLQPHPNWDSLLLEASTDIDNFKQPRYFGVHDGNNDFGSFIIYVANRAFADRLGWILYPEYDGLYADSDISEVARRSGWAHPCPHITFDHRHFLRNDINIDTDRTYTRHNNDAGHLKNWAIYEQRKARNFDVDQLLRHKDAK